MEVRLTDTWSIHMAPSDILFGTAGWSYADWEGTVYPLPRPRPFNPLEFLARDFNFVEVNTTFYRIPALKLTQGWVEKTAALPDFRFWIKVYQEFTHKRRSTPDEIDRFVDACRPLIDAGKLTGFLAQFPYSFKLSTPNLAYIGRLQEDFAPHPLAVEFRHAGWDHPDVIREFSERELIWVNIDQPVISRSLPLTAHLTHPDITYVRLHGRNYESWFANHGRDARYDYDYSAAELTSIGEKIKKLAALAREVFVSGNNHYKGQAIKNLKELREILKSG